MSENWPPKAVFDRLEAANHRTAVNAAASFATYLGAPVVHAAHAGELRCAMPWLPLPYRGRFEGGTLITDAGGTVLHAIDRRDGEGFAIADVEPGRIGRSGSRPTAFGYTGAGRWRRWPGTTSASTAGPGTASTSAAGRRGTRASRPRSS